MKYLLSLHRWLGVIACLAVLMFASSGLLHPIMSRTQPQPVQRIAPPITLPSAILPNNEVPLATVLRQHGIETFIATRIVGLPSGAAYRVQIDSQSARYFAVADGAEIAAGERQHAELLARHFSGEHGAVLKELSEVKNFDADYLWVNRLLPVWQARFERDDGLTVYVDTQGNRLASIVDNRKRFLQTIFRNMHDFEFLESVPWLRLPLMLVLLTATFSTAIAGLTLFVKLKNTNNRLQRAPVRRWHRRLALLVSLTMLSFSFSGTWHLVQSEFIAEQKDYPALVESFRTSELGAYQPSAAFTLARVNGVACYRLATAKNTASGDEHAHHAMTAQHSPAIPHQADTSCETTDSGTPLHDADRDKALELARHFAQTDSSNTNAAVTSSTLVDSFGGEYGFINKRLPVWKVLFADSNTRWYVETSSGALALRADDNAALEGFIFAYVHKWSFIGENHKNIRDGLMMLFALGNIIVALLGLQLFIARRFRLRTRNTA